MAGIDFGNANCYMAVARNKGIEIIDNDYSLHATPSCVSFGQFARLMGFGARQQLLVNHRNSAINFKHMLGRSFSDPVAQAIREFIPCEIVQLPNDQIGFKVSHLGASRTFSPDQLMGCLFTHLRSLLSKSLSADVTECVINVPYHYNERQRIALTKAGRIAGLTLRLINDHASLAYCYGMYKGASLPAVEETPKLVVFVDAGHSGVQASIVAFNASKAQILGAVHDLTAGGLHLDALLRDHFRSDFRERFRIDAKQNPRAWLRLLDECEKLKKQMSANKDKIPLNIECFMNDVDVHGQMHRAQFEGIAEPLFQKIQQLLLDLVKNAQVQIEDISDVELIGGSTRIPRVKQIIAEFFKKEPKTTMNQDDAEARGCALRSALLYPAYQMKPFQMVDPYDLAVDGKKLPTEEMLTEEFNAEQEMQAADLRDKQRSDAKNALEEYCFKVQHAMEDEQLCQDKLAHEERHDCINKCNGVLDWLDSESETLQRKQIDCRHEELEKYCGPLLAKLYAVAQQQNGASNAAGDNADYNQPPPPNEQSQNRNTGGNGGNGGPIVEEPMD